MRKHVGILTAGGDSPGLNAAIRAVGKACHDLGMRVTGFRDGFRGLMENRTLPLEPAALSGILTVGGTILGTSRAKPHRMNMGGKTVDMRDVILETCRKQHLDVVVCMGGGGTQKNAYRLAQHGIEVITLPKTIDNDVPMTDVAFGFDTALGIATEGIDRLHSTAHSHHRIIVVETMGHNAGWLALGSGIAGGADVILIPEIAYDVEKVAEGIRHRSREGKRFSIVAVSEGAMSGEEVAAFRETEMLKESPEDKDKASKRLKKLHRRRQEHTLKLAQDLERLTGLEARLTILGHLQRGGAPSAADRLLATRLGTTCAALIAEGQHGVMVAARGDGAKPVPLEDVVGKRKSVPLDHPWIDCARRVGTSFGD